MKICEEYYDLIVFFDDLSPDEKQEVQNHTEECSNCRKHFTAFQAITTGLKQREHAGHVDEALLTRYGIYLSNPDEPDYDGRRLTRQEITAVEEHVNRCQPCQQKVARITAEFREVDEYLAQEGVPSLSLGGRASRFSIVKEKALNFFEAIAAFLENAISLPRPQLYPIAATALAGVVILLWVSPLFRGSEHGYYQLAALELKNEKFSYLTRGEASELLSAGLHAFERGEYEKSAESLEKFIAANPDDPSLFYAHYVTGIASLSHAKSDFLGRFHKIDAGLVDSGIQHLQAAINSTDNLRVKEDAYWFMGKAYLLRQNEQKAKEAFTQVEQIKGRRFKAAREIIAEINKIQTKQ